MSWLTGMVLRRKSNGSPASFIASASARRYLVGAETRASLPFLGEVVIIVDVRADRRAELDAHVAEAAEADHAIFLPGPTLYWRSGDRW